MKKIFIFPVLLVLSIYLGACSGIQQRGMLGEAYVSSTRPAICVEVKDMPLMTYGTGIPNMTWTSMLGGLPIQTWVAVYGSGGLAPMAIVAQAEVPEGWYWDSNMKKPFSVDEGVEIFDNVAYQACTYIVSPRNDPFGQLITGTDPDGQPQMWLVRNFAARFNFNTDKIILQYREPLPEGVVTLSQLPYGHSELLVNFERRAREAFVVTSAPQDMGDVKEGYSDAIQWQYMGQNFLGTVSQYSPFAR